MIDFNTVLNTLLGQIIEQASAPLIKRIDDLEAQVKSLIDASTADFSGFAFRDAVSCAIDNYDLDDKFDRWAENGKTFDRAVESVCDDVISKHEREYDHDDFLDVGDGNLKEKVLDIIKEELTFEVTVS